MLRKKKMKINQSAGSRLLGLRFLLLFLPIFFIQSCAVEFYQTHGGPMVKYPTEAAMLTGYFTGLPLAIPVGLVTVPIGLIVNKTCPLKDVTKFWVLAGPPLVPAILLEFASGFAVGTPCWFAFGWWWPDPPPEPTTDSTNPGEDNKNGSRPERQ